MTIASLVDRPRSEKTAALIEKLRGWIVDAEKKGFVGVVAVFVGGDGSFLTGGTALDDTTAMIGRLEVLKHDLVSRWKD